MYDVYSMFMRLKPSVMLFRILEVDQMTSFNYYRVLRMEILVTYNLAMVFCFDFEWDGEIYASEPATTGYASSLSAGT